MIELAVNELAPSLRQLAVKAREASARGDLAVVKNLSSQVLAAEPGCVGMRKVWFEAEMQQPKRATGLLSRLQGALVRSKKHRNSGGGEAHGMTKADAILAADFANRTGWQMLIDQAEVHGLLETKLLAWRTFARIYRDDAPIALGWASALLQANRETEALEIAQGVLQRDSTDGAAVALVRQISVAVTLKSGRLKDR
jgi:hypothetical protein